MKRGMNAATGIAAVIVFCFIFYLSGIGCPIKFITGISCGGCGMTRACISLFTLDVKGALYYHPLVFLPPVYAAVFAFKRRIGKRIFDVITAAFAVIFLAVYFIRLFNPENIIVTADIKSGLIFRLINFITEGNFYD